MKLQHILLLLGLLFQGSAYGGLEGVETLIKNQKFAEAYAMVQPMVDSEMGNPTFDLFYGIAARETGHPELAVFAFERVLMANKRDPRAHYEMALALVKVSDFRGAKRSLENTQRFAQSPTLKGNASQLLTVVERTLRRTRKPLVFFHGVMSVGYNSNVNSSPIDFVVGPPGPALQDGYANLSLFAYFEKKITKHDSLYFSLGSTNRKNFQSQTYDFNTLFGRMGFQTRLGCWELKVPFSTEFVILDYLGKVLSVAGGVELERSWDSTHFVDVDASVKAKRFTQASNNQALMNLAASYKGRFMRRTLAFDATFFYNPTISRGQDGIIGPSVKDDIGFLLRGKYEFIRSHSLFGEVKYTNFNFWMVPANGVRQNDNNFAMQAGYAWKFATHWSLVATYFFVYNQSNVTTFNYLRHQAELGLSASF